MKNKKQKNDEVLVIGGRATGMSRYLQQPRGLRNSSWISLDDNGQHYLCKCDDNNNRTETPIRYITDSIVIKTREYTHMCQIAEDKDGNKYIITPVGPSNVISTPLNFIDTTPQQN